MIEGALRARKVSAIQAANAAGINREAIRSVIRGRSPTYSRLVEICNAVGLKLIIRAGGASEHDQHGTVSPSGRAASLHGKLSELSTTRRLRVRIASENGSWKTHIDNGDAAAPEGLADPQAFYVVADDESLAPAGIRKGDHVLVSPNGQIGRDTLIWLQRSDGRESLRWLAHWWAGGFETLYWTSTSTENNRPELHAEQVRLAETARQGTVVAVYGGRPSTRRPAMQRVRWP